MTRICNQTKLDNMSKHKLNTDSESELHRLQSSDLKPKATGYLWSNDRSQKHEEKIA